MTFNFHGSENRRGFSQSGLYVLVSASCGTYYTSQLSELFTIQASSLEPLANVTACIQSLLSWFYVSFQFSRFIPYFFSCYPTQIVQQQTSPLFTCTSSCDLPCLRLMATWSVRFLVMWSGECHVVLYLPFLPRDAMHKRGLCRHAVSVCHVRRSCEN